MKRTPLLIAVALALTALIAASSYFVCVFSSCEVGYADLSIKEHSYDNHTFTIEVSVDEDGMYLYKVLATQNSEGDLELTFRGGKQPSMAQTPNKAVATFQIDVPAGTQRIVCDGMTVYTIK